MVKVVWYIVVFCLIGAFALGWSLRPWYYNTPVKVEVVATNGTPVTPEAAKLVVTEPATVQQVKASVPECADRSYTVVRGDNLYNIAKKEYRGRAYLYPYLAEVNHLAIPRMIHPGQELKIPCKVELCCLSELVTKVPAKKTATRKVASVKREKAPAKTVVKVETPAPPPVPAPTPASAPVAQPAPAAQAQVAAPPAPIPPAPQVQVNVEQKNEQKVEPAIVLPPKTSLGAPEVNKSEVTTWQKEEVKTKATGLRAPGSMWDTFIFEQPLEPDNPTNYFHVDQGFILASSNGAQLKPYVAFNTVKDEKGFPWNNREKGEVGVRAEKLFSHGIASVGTAYASETRHGKGLPRDTKSGFSFYTDGWIGNDQPTPSSGSSMLSSLPGSAWWIVGRGISPFEGDNITLTARGEQGVTLAKLKRLSIIPEAWGQVSKDTKGYSYNNRYIYGGGLRIPLAFGSGMIDAVVGYECGKEYGKNAISSQATCGPKVTADLWNGWLAKIGGK